MKMSEWKSFVRLRIYLLIWLFVAGIWIQFNFWPYIVRIVFSHSAFRACYLFSFLTHQYSLLVWLLLTSLIQFPSQMVPYLLVGLMVYWTSSLWKKADIPYVKQTGRNQEERREMKEIWWEEQHCFPVKQKTPVTLACSILCRSLNDLFIDPPRSLRLTDSIF